MFKQKSRLRSVSLRIVAHFHVLVLLSAVAFICYSLGRKVHLESLKDLTIFSTAATLVDSLLIPFHFSPQFQADEFHL